jgi:hypothetical protein
MVTKENQRFLLVYEVMNDIVHVIPQVSKMKAYIFNYKIHVHEIMLCMIFYKTTRFN